MVGKEATGANLSLLKTVIQEMKIDIKEESKEIKNEVKLINGLIINVLHVST